MGEALLLRAGRVCLLPSRALIRIRPLNRPPPAKNLATFQTLMSECACETGLFQCHRNPQHIKGMSASLRNAVQRSVKTHDPYAYGFGNESLPYLRVPHRRNRRRRVTRLRTYLTQH